MDDRVVVSVDGLRQRFAEAGHEVTAEDFLAKLEDAGIEVDEGGNLVQYKSTVVGFSEIGERVKRIGQALKLQRVREADALLRQQVLDATSDLDVRVRDGIWTRMFGRLEGAIEPRWTAHSQRNPTHFGRNRSERRQANGGNGKLGVTRAPSQRDRRRVSRRLRRAHQRGQAQGNQFRNVPVHVAPYESTRDGYFSLARSGAVSKARY